MGTWSLRECITSNSYTTSNCFPSSFADLTPTLNPQPFVSPGVKESTTPPPPPPPPAPAPAPATTTAATTTATTAEACDEYGRDEYEMRWFDCYKVSLFGGGWGGKP